MGSRWQNKMKALSGTTFDCLFIHALLRNGVQLVKKFGIGYK